MTKGDIVLFKPAKAVITKGSDNLARMIKQYDSPCVIYQVINNWVYLYRLIDGGIHVAQCNDNWKCVDVDLNMYMDRLDTMAHLLEVGLG